MTARKQSLHVYFFLDKVTSRLVPNQLQLTHIMDLFNPEGWGHTVLGREAHQAPELLQVDGLSRRRESHPGSVPQNQKIQQTVNIYSFLTQ